MCHISKQQNGVFLSRTNAKPDGTLDNRYVVGLSPAIWDRGFPNCF